MILSKVITSYHCYLIDHYLEREIEAQRRVIEATVKTEEVQILSKESTEF